MSSITPPEPEIEQAEADLEAAVSADHTPAPEETEQPAESAIPQTDVAATSVTSIEDVHPKMALKGTIRSAELQGAIVEIEGLEKPGLLHISQLSEEPVKNVTDVVKKGDSVTVFVLAVDKKSGRLDLTLIQPPDMTWNEIKVGERVQGTVERIEKYGVFINIGAERAAMIHVSELANGYVNDPSDVVKIGDSVEAKVINVNKRKKQIDLSIRALEAEDMAIEIEEEEEPEAAITAMELALRKAMGDDGRLSRREREKKRDKRKKTRSQDDIIERTLRWNQNG